MHPCNHRVMLWPQIRTYLMWLTLSFSWSVCFCVYIYHATPGGPCPPYSSCRMCGMLGCSFVSGDSVCVPHIHQRHTLPLFSWAYGVGETVTTSVACSSVYIMARFFDGWWLYPVDAQTIPYPPIGQWTFGTRLCDIFSVHIYSATKNVPAGTK